MFDRFSAKLGPRPLRSTEFIAQRRLKQEPAPSTKSKAISWQFGILDTLGYGNRLTTLCYAIVLPGRKSAFRAGFWQDCYLESTDIGPPAGRRADFGAVPVAVRPKSVPEGRFTARKHYCVT